MSVQNNRFAFLALSALISCSPVQSLPDPEQPRLEYQCGPFTRFQTRDGFTLEQVPGPTFNNPSALAVAPGDPTRWYVSEVGSSELFRFSPGDAAAELVGSFDEFGTLLGFAFHPGFEGNGKLYGFFIHVMPGIAYRLKLMEFTWSAATNRFENADARLILTFDEPEAFHNGGHVAFGLDGYLYLGTGEGGAGEVSQEPQNPFNLQGKVLRIDVDAADPAREKLYSIPASNPFADGVDGAPEVYAMGFRNPWRWSFDRVTGDLWLGDVGADRWEEVNLVEPGRNYGWPRTEGLECYEPECDPAEFAAPVAVYPHTGISGFIGASITGGFVYRGAHFPQLGGRYVFADWFTGKIGALESSDLSAIETLTETGLQIVAIAEDHEGELFFLDYAGGGVYRLISSENIEVPNANNPPATLDGTMCFLANSSEPTAALVPYSVSAPLWSDGAQKQRYIVLPEGTSVSSDGEGNWQFPLGTMLLKHFAMAGKPLETRFLIHDDAGWVGYTYVWDETGSSAALTRTGASVDDGQGGSWVVPSEAQCMTCHTAQAGYVLGFKPEQLGTQQLTDLGRLFDSEPDVTGAYQLRAPDSEAALEERARSYLDANCAGCHRGDGPGRATMDLRGWVPLEDTRVCDEKGNTPSQASVLLSPGHPEDSAIIERMTATGSERMPPLGTRVIDAEAVQLISDWITLLGADGCP